MCLDNICKQGGREKMFSDSFEGIIVRVESIPHRVDSLLASVFSFEDSIFQRIHINLGHICYLIWKNRSHELQLLQMFLFV